MSNFPNKIMIFGRPGAGKSTFAFDLHKVTGLPLYHLDKYFFESNWVERNYQEFLLIQQKIVNKSEWIIDGNSSQSLEMRYSKADLVLYFNYPRWICYWRVFKRLFNKSPFIDDRAINCKETVRLSLIRYMWSFEKRVNPKIEMLKQKYPDTKFIEIYSDKNLNNLKVNFMIPLELVTVSR